MHRTIINQQLTKFLNETQTIKNEIARLMRLSGVNFPFYVVEYRSISIDGEPINETREEHTFLSHLSEAEQILLTYEDRQVDEFDIDSTGTNIREYSTRYESETPLHLIARYGRSCIDVELAELIIHSYSEADIALLQTDPKLLPFICQNLSYEIRAFYARHGFSAVLEAAIEHRGSSLPLASIAMAEVGTSITSGNAAGSHGNRI